jgi:serine protease AprX
VIVPDAPVRASSFGNSQQWPHATGNSRLWLNDEATYSAAMPTIAIVDSGIEAGRADFAGRVVADVKLGLGEGDEGDSRGHGTFVAGIAAGAAEGYAGAAPMAKIFSIDVMDANGMAFVSDVIAACEVILANKNSHNIRVANFSLHSAWPASVRWDPLAHAVEKLWFSGIVVVAAAGNYGNADGPSGVGFAPGSDPFVITVGAGDLTGGAPGTRPRVNSPAPWSAWGYTHDGFAKPELVAPGRYMVAAVPESSTLVAERPGSVVAPGYMQLSGTSFAAPVVSGTVAQMLARNPNLTPDQVKGALMLTARPVEGAPQGAAGVGQITASRAIAVSSPPNPNAGLNQFLVYGGGELPIFDAEAWGEAVQSDAAWNGAAWSDAAWSSAAWSSAAWSSAAWSSGSFEAAAWSDAAWSSAAWSDAAWSDGAGYDGTADTQISSEQLAQLDCDPELSSPEDGGGADCGGESAGGESGGSESGGESGGEQPTEESGSEQPTEESSSEQSTEESGGEQAEEGTGEGSTEELGEQPAEEYSGE